MTTMVYDGGVGMRNAVDRRSGRGVSLLRPILSPSSSFPLSYSFPLSSFSLIFLFFLPSVSGIPSMACDEVWGWGTPLMGVVRAEQAHAPTITFYMPLKMGLLGLQDLYGVADV
jgi:hypothetical protein